VRTHLLLLLLLFQGCVGNSANEPESPVREDRPNIVLIVADDLGYADLGAQGSNEVLTPNIDSLAAAGVRFTSGYVSSPQCSPTRAGLLTGRYQQRFGHEVNPPDPVPAGFGLPLDEVTIAERLVSAGYATALIGKWHLGAEAPFHPLNRGFQEFFGFLGGSHSYFEWNSATDPILRGYEPVSENVYLTEALTREAVSFVERKSASPFFLCLTYNAVHRPLEEPPQEYMELFANVADPKRRKFLAMLAALDKGVGTVLDAIRSAGIEQSTLIVFHSDNGGLTTLNTSLNLPLRGEKAQLWEGGIRVPFILRWTDRVPGGIVYDHPVVQFDISATILAAAGISRPRDLVTDGVNLVPYLDGTDPGEPHASLFWRFGELLAARKGRWKLVKIGAEPSQLFNLETDIGETSDLALAHGDVVSELEAEIAIWQAQLVPALW